MKFHDFSLYLPEYKKAALVLKSVKVDGEFSTFEYEVVPAFYVNFMSPMTAPIEFYKKNEEALYNVGMPTGDQWDGFDLNNMEDMDPTRNYPDDDVDGTYDSSETNEPIVEETKLFDPSLPKINVYSGTGENAELSNFANRPFTDDGIGDLGMNYKEATGKSIVFNTVEGFFQASKIQYSNSSEYWDKSKDGWTLTKRGIELIEKFAKATGSEAKSLGRTIKELDTKEWDKYSSQEMKGGLLASFEQNPDALVKLLSTGNATLTHTQDKGKWGVEFPKLLMEVRTELAEQQTQNLWSQYQQASIEIYSQLGNNNVKCLLSVAAFGIQKFK